MRKAGRLALGDLLEIAAMRGVAATVPVADAATSASSSAAPAGPSAPAEVEGLAPPHTRSNSNEFEAAQELIAAADASTGHTLAELMGWPPQCFMCLHAFNITGGLCIGATPRTRVASCS